MKFKLTLFFYVILYLALAIFSYGFVDANFPLKTPKFLYDLVHSQRSLATIIHVTLIVALFTLYGLVLRQVGKKEIKAKQIWQLIFLGSIILFFSFPAFSYDLFNYLATAKVTFFYKENPYWVMPIEFISEPMLKFMHAANKFALYGPFWILLTAIPYFLAGGNLLLSLFTFKAFIFAFYLGLLWLIWQLSKKDSFSLAFFGLNPLVIIETLVAGHNDVVMMFFAFLSLYWLFQERKTLSFVSLLVSIGIKYATIVLLPFLALFSRLKREKLILFSYWALFLVFFLSPLREEIYSWYFIWVLSFAALMTDKKFLFWLSLAFSFGLLFRYSPFLYTRSWQGITPWVKQLVTFIPPTGIILAFSLRKAFRK